MTAEAAAKKALRDMGGYELDRVASALGMPFTLDTDRLLLREMSLIRPENLPSQGVARRIGMVPERRAMHANLEHVVFALSSERESSPRSGHSSSSS